MANSPHLGFNLLDLSQSSKEVTANVALLAIEALMNMSVISRSLTAPPGSPANGDVYIPAATATGAWVGKENQIAYFITGSGWSFIVPRAGLTVYSTVDAGLISYSGTVWASSTAILAGVSQLGVNGTADATNKFLVQSAAILLNNIGNGIQVKLNKNAAGDTNSFLFQTGFSGRAELGCTGTDDFQFKYSPDGSTFNVGLRGHSKLHGRTAVKDAFRRYRGEMIVQPGLAAVTSLGTQPTTDGTLNLVAPTSSNYFTASPRVKYTSAAGAGSSCGNHPQARFLWRGNGGGLGGFYAVFRGGIETFQTGARMFMGLYSTNTVIGNVNPSTLVDMIGIGCDTGSTTLSLFYNDGSGTASSVSLGASFPTNSGQSMYELILSAEPNGSEIRYRVENLNSGAVNEGTLTTDLITNTVFVGPHFWYNNAATAAAVEFAMAHFYCESGSSVGSAGVM